MKPIKQDWIDKLNEEFKGTGDGLLVEMFICFVDSKKQGEEFLRYLREQIKNGAS